jgi:catechol 2,3-dioxygenase-like lactoylglutathione lyase family enzyme
VAGVVVRDKERSKRFFRDRVGMKVLHAWGHWVVMGDKRRGARLHLCQVKDSDKKHPSEKGDAGILILTDQTIATAYRRMRAKGVRFIAPPRREEWGWRCQSRDPDGSVYWLMPHA